MKKPEIQITEAGEEAVFNRMLKRTSAGADALIAHQLLSALVDDTKQKLGGDARLESPRMNSDIAKVVWPALTMDITVPSPRAMHPNARKVVGRYVVDADSGDSERSISLWKGARRRKIVYAGRSIADLAAHHVEALISGNLKFMGQPR